MQVEQALVGHGGQGLGRTDDGGSWSRSTSSFRNGTLVDRTGGPSRRIDVGLREGRIAAIDDLADAAAPVDVAVDVDVDATGRIVVTGFRAPEPDGVRHGCAVCTTLVRWRSRSLRPDSPAAPTCAAST